MRLVDLVVGKGGFLQIASIFSMKSGARPPIENVRGKAKVKDRKSLLWKWEMTD